MIIGVLKEEPEETRVSLLPEAVMALKKLNAEVWVAPEAGAKAYATDADYEKAGASIHSPAEIMEQSDLILKINPFTAEETAKIHAGKLLLGVYQPLNNISLLQEYAAKGWTVFSLDNIPRTTRAQSMDVLSSQANIAGYKAVLLAAYEFGHYFPMFITAAGSIAPAKVLILGAGVAGLQAIATARRLGAVVEVSDTRPAVKEEVMSLGGRFIEVEGAADVSAAGGYAVEQSEKYKQRQQAKIAERIRASDIIITTAQIPGKKAPVLITQEMLDKMKAGSIIIDLAAATGGNTALTKNNETIIYNKVRIIGNSNLAASMPADASKVYGKNVINFLKLIINKDGELNLNFEDDLVKGTCITHNGELTNERVKQFLPTNSKS